MLKPESWFILAVALLGMIAAVVAYLRTPADKRNRFSRPSAEELLAASAPADKAVIIRADRRRAYRRDLPQLVLLVPVAAVAMWIEVTHGNPCASLLGIGRTRLALGALFVIPPVLVLTALVVVIVPSVRALRGGYWPPLDTAVYRDTLAITGRKVRLRAFAALLLFGLLLPVLAYSYARVLGIFGPAEIRARLQQAEHRCLSHP